MPKALELIQKISLFKRLSLKVQGNRELVLIESGPFKSARFVIPLEQINPAPSQVRDLSMQWIVVTGIFGALTLWDLYLLLTGSHEPAGFFVLLFFAAITFACYVNTVQLSRNLVIFFNISTGNRMFSISRSKPSAEAVDGFVDQLRQRIESFRSPSGVSREQLLPLYKRHLDYLLDESVLLPAEYDAAIARLAASVTPNNVLELVR